MPNTYDDLLRNYNFTNLQGYSGQSSDNITPTSGVYEIDYTYLTSASVATIDYHSANTNYYSAIATSVQTHFTTITTQEEDAVDTILSNTGSPDPFSVYFADVGHLTFIEAGSNGAIAIGSSDHNGVMFPHGADDAGVTFGTGVDSQTGINQNAGLNGDVWLDSDFSAVNWSSTLSPGTYGFEILLHELSHALGLKHPTANAALDNQQYSIMAQYDHASPDVSGVYLSGLQLEDIAAVQSIYGYNYATRGTDDTGTTSVNEANTIYTAGTGQAFGGSTTPFIYTIWDGAGLDLFDVSPYTSSTNAQIDLRQGHFSSVGTNGSSATVSFDTFPSGVEVDHGNVAIAYYAVIENAWGTGFTGSGDNLIGNAWNNILYGAAGDDYIYGDGTSYDQNAGFHDNAPDSLRPGPNADTNLSGNDVLIGGYGSDTLYGGKGNDVLHGGYVKSDIDSATSTWSTYWDAGGQFTGTHNASGAALTDISSSDGYDVANYSRLYYGDTSKYITAHVSGSSISVDKGVSGADGQDTLFSVEAIVGTEGDDQFYVNAINGIYFDGGDGVNTADYSGLGGAIVVTVSGGIPEVQAAGSTGSSYPSDALSVQKLVATPYDDTITMSGSDDTIVGGAGADVIHGGTGNDYFVAHAGTAGVDGDSYSGDAGWDTVNYSSVSAGIVLMNSAIGATVQQATHSGLSDPADVLQSVQNFIGTAGNDKFYGEDGTADDGAGHHLTYNGADGNDRYYITIPSSTTSFVEIVDNSATADYSSATVQQLDIAGFNYTSYFNYTTVTTGGNTYLDISIHNWDGIVGHLSTKLLTVRLNETDLDNGLSVQSMGFTGASPDDVFTTSTKAFVTWLTSHAPNTYVRVGPYVASGDMADGVNALLGTAPQTHTAPGTDGYTGDIDGMIMPSSLGEHWGPSGYATDTVHPWVLSSASTSGGSATVVWHSWIKDVQLNSGLTGDDVRLTYSGSSTDTLTVHIDSLSTSFDIGHFASGRTISGHTIYNDNLNVLVQNDPAATLTTGGMGDYTGTYTDDGTWSGLASGSVNPTYFFETLTFDDTTFWDMQADGLTFTGTGSTDALYGRDGKIDVLLGLAGNDTLDGGTGADTLVGGGGNDTFVVDNAGDTVTGDTGTDTVLSSVAFTLSSELENLTLTGSASVSGTGNSANNIITGNSGNNTLDGDSGTDSLIGGAGNDTYLVDSTTDTITENTSQGTDTVSASVTFSLSAIGNVENLTLTGSSNINGTGNTLNNVLTSNSGVNTLTGGDGDDTYVIKNASDVVVENSNQGTDVVQANVSYTLSSEVENLTLTGASAINGTGNNADNIIIGNSASNSINGLFGSDTMIGGGGDDTYVVSIAGDVVTENASEGTDLIQTSVNYTLSANVENLTLLSGGALNGTGNNLVNVITGNSNGNSLDGSTGADTLIGGTASDTYVVDNAGDILIENANEGLDMVRSSITWTLTTDFENLTLTGSADINATGNSVSNTLTGNSGNNTLDGGASTDSMVGGAGNDVYIVDNTNDLAIESSSAGTDLVQSSVTFTLGANVESLTLTGSSNINGTGNALSNVLTGNSGNNSLNGSTGADTLIGGGGNDNFIVDDTGDSVTAGSGTDTIQSSISWDMSASGHNNTDVEILTLSSGNINATGNDLTNIINGGGGNNTLDGSVGADTMIGGAGNDTYIVEDANDVVSEVSGSGGNDTVLSSITYSLGANLENLTLTGSSNINGTGTAVVNIMTGNSGDNSLNGGSGADTMIGGGGNDTFIVDNTGDSVTGGSGTDIVSSSVSFTLSSAVEHLTLTGSSAINGTGNALDNVLIGNSGANTLSASSGIDTLDGGNGLDSLTGGTGADTFVFHLGTAFNNIDVVTDFNVSTDNDKLDVHDILGGYDPAHDVITNWVRITDSGSNSIVEVDRDGTGGTYSFAQIATLNGITGLTDEAALVSSGNLIVA